MSTEKLQRMKTPIGEAKWAHLQKPKAAFVDKNGRVKGEPKYQLDVVFTQEVLFIRKGVLRVDFYDDNKNYLESKILKSGDTILLAMVGHGFEVLENVEMVEVKQGPYVEHDDKVRFAGISAESVIIKKARN